MSKPHDINIGFELRPCIVGGVKALFHRWVDDEKRAAKLRVPATFALVEYETGDVRLVPLKSVRFLDSLNKFAGIDFGEGKGDAVPVVRCQNCVNFMEYCEEYKERVQGADGDCRLRLLNSDFEQFCAVEKNDYCSLGIKKEVGGIT